ncbi:MAG: argininosuccinate lyase [Candidatus Micrarchaeia archaeon]
MAATKKTKTSKHEKSHAKPAHPAKMLWQGRLAASPKDIVFDYMSSENIALDKALVEYDIEGSIAHALMLAKAGIIKQDEAKAIVGGLMKILLEQKDGKFEMRKEFEDVHMNVESALTKMTDNGKKLHTGRSRNDQINLDMRMYMRREILSLLKSLHMLGSSLASLSEKRLPYCAYTHTRVAQPISVAYWAGAYFAGFERDAKRLANAYDMLNSSPLGSGAVAGTTLPIDREYTARLLGFDSVQENATDCSSSRGEFEADVAYACSTIMMRLSRMAEEIIWQSQKGLIDLPDEYCTGSSMMPQKKNADIFELVRGRCAREYSNLFHVLAVMKSLPLGYNSDTQETKYAIMSALKTANDSTRLVADAASKLEFNKEKIMDEIESGFGCATELSDVFVKHGTSFRDAHGHVGSIVKHLIAGKRAMSSLTSAEIENLVAMRIPQSEISAACNPDKSSRYLPAITKAKLDQIGGMVSTREARLDTATKEMEAEMDKLFGNLPD